MNEFQQNKKQTKLTSVCASVLRLDGTSDDDDDVEFTLDDPL